VAAGELKLFFLYSFFYTREGRKKSQYPIKREGVLRGRKSNYLFNTSPLIQMLFSLLTGLNVSAYRQG
jgi:hypothetical protein